MKSSVNATDIFKILIAEIHGCVPELVDQPITMESSMLDMGINSMERAEILVATLEAIELAIPMTSLHGPENIGELVDLLYEKKSAE